MPDEEDESSSPSPDKEEERSTCGWSSAHPVKIIPASANDEEASSDEANLATACKGSSLEARPGQGIDDEQSNAFPDHEGECQSSQCDPREGSVCEPTKKRYKAVPNPEKQGKILKKRAKVRVPKAKAW